MFVTNEQPTSLYTRPTKILRIEMDNPDFVVASHKDENYQDCFRVRNIEAVHVQTGDIYRMSRIVIPDTVHDKIPIEEHLGFRWVVYSMDHEYLHVILFWMLGADACAMLDLIDLSDVAPTL